MLIAVISDTHRVAKYINIAKEYIKSADVLIHLGDNSEDIEELTNGFKGKVYGVIEAYRDQGMSEVEILKWIQKKFTITVDEAKEYMAHEDGK